MQPLLRKAAMLVSLRCQSQAAGPATGRRLAGALFPLFEDPHESVDYAAFMRDGAIKRFEYSQTCSG